MRRLLIALFFSIATLCTAQVYNVTSTAVAIRVKPYDWGDWVSSIVPITVDAVNDRVVINSQAIQVYRIIQNTYQSRTELRWRVIDQDGDYGTLRMLFQSDCLHIYIEFTNIAWVYYVPK